MNSMVNLYQYIDSPTPFVLFEIHRCGPRAQSARMCQDTMWQGPGAELGGLLWSLPSLPTNTRIISDHLKLSHIHLRKHFMELVLDLN